MITVQVTLFDPFPSFGSFSFYEGLALITQKQALLWTDGRYFLQAIQQLSDQWKLMRIGEDPSEDLWMADVCDSLFDDFTSHYNKGNLKLKFIIYFWN